MALQPSDVALQGSFTIYLGANRGRGQAYPTGKLVNGESIVLSCQLSGEWLYVRLYPRCDHEDVMPFFSPLQEWIPLLHWRCDQRGGKIGLFGGAGVGERTREGNDLYTEMVDSKVIVPESLPDSKVSLIYGQTSAVGYQPTLAIGLQRSIPHRWHSPSS